MLRRGAFLWLQCLLIAAFSGTAHAEDDRVRAAAEFEVGLKLYERADYAAAARAFLRADELVPSEDAIKNSIAAARKASDHLTVARASRRALSRPGASAELASAAREALAQAAPHLARLELSCEPEPCELRVDEESVRPGEHWVLPGTHRALAGHAGRRSEQDIVTQPGATYRVVLRVPAGAATEPVAEQASPAQVPPAQPAPGAVEQSRSGRPLSPAVFYVGTAATIVLTAATIWSGLDTLSARDELPSQPTTGQVDAVRTRVRRTDFLLAGTLVVAAGSGYAGLFLVDWSAGEQRASTLGLFASGRF